MLSSLYVQADVCAEVVSALKPICTGAGVEIDCEPQEMLTIVSLLDSGGYRLPVAASSAGWSFDQPHCPAKDLGTVGSSVGGVQVLISSVDASRYIRCARGGYRSGLCRE